METTTDDTFTTDSMETTTDDTFTTDSMETTTDVNGSIM